MKHPIRTVSAAVCVALLVGLRGLGQGQAPTAPQSAAPGPAPAPVAQQPSDVTINLTKEGGRRIAIAIPGVVAPYFPEGQGQVAEPFQKTLTDDLAISPFFVVADPSLYPKGFRPPSTREEGDAWIASGAQFLLDTQIQTEGANAVVVAYLHDLRTLRPVLSKKYTAPSISIRRVAHVLANDVVRQFTGRPGPYLSKIVFSSDRDGARLKELYLMDFDGANQRRITNHRSLSIAPDWSYDGERIVYQSYVGGAAGLFWISKNGGDKVSIPVSTGLNSSPSFSPDGKTVAYSGSVKGNPEIFTVGLDGANLKRLTVSAAVDSTPRFSPNGREIAFTSNRQGTPQVYVMDLEGANVRRVTMAGNWSDEASYSPDGSKLAYACRNEGDFQICILDILSGRTIQISEGGGTNENPTWSPDGTRIAWEVQRGSSTQIVSANADGSAVKVLTSVGNNMYPAWSKTLE